MISLEQAHAVPASSFANATVLIDIPIATKALRVVRTSRSAASLPDDAVRFRNFGQSAVERVLP